jgi:hypothetical protein
MPPTASATAERPATLNATMTLLECLQE